MMKRFSWLAFFGLSILFTSVACLSGSSAEEVLEEGEVLPNGLLFRPVSFSSPLDGPGIQVHFPGQNKVKVTLRQSDGEPGVARGRKVATLKKQVDLATFADLADGTYDLVLQQGASKWVRDDIVVAGTPVILHDVTSGLVIDFGGLENVQVAVRLDDGLPDSVGGGVWTINRQSGLQTYPILGGSYDVRLRLGATEYVIHGVDCDGGPCAVSGIGETLTVDFGELENVQLALRVSDGEPGTIGGSVWTQNRQSGVADYLVLNGEYDLRFRHGAAEFIIDDVDCTQGPCSASGITELLTVDFGGLENIQLALRVADGTPNTIGGSVWTKNRQSDVNTYHVLKADYDLRFRHGAAEFIIDDVACSLGPCSASGIEETLTVDFGALENIQLALRVADGAPNTIGGSVWTKNRQSGVVSYSVLKADYDLRFRHGAAEFIIDDVACGLSPCAASGIAQTLTVDFDELAAIQLSLRVSDGVEGTVGGSVWTKNAQSGVREYDVLRAAYDLRFRQAAAELIIDAVDCSTEACSAGGISTDLTVDLGDTENVKVQLRSMDGEPETVGRGVWTRTNQSGSSTHAVLRDLYDLKLVIDGENHIVDGIDCYSAACGVAFIEGVAVDNSSIFAEPEVEGARIEPTPTVVSVEPAPTAVSAEPTATAVNPEPVPTVVSAEPTPTEVRVESTPTRVPIPAGRNLFEALTPEERRKFIDGWRFRPTPTPVPPTPTPAVPPGRVSEVEVQPGDGEALLTWSEPNSIGGSEIQTYRIVIIPIQRVEIVNGSQRQLLITGLENGVAYRVQINAINADGFGERLLTDEFVPSGDVVLSGDDE